jgi:hypothetical protein
MTMNVDKKLWHEYMQEAYKDAAALMEYRSARLRENGYIDEAAPAQKVAKEIRAKAARRDVLFKKKNPTP